MKQLQLQELATQYITDRDRYGDLVLVSTGTIKCMFRNVSKLTRGINAEDVQISGIFWFDPATTLKKGDVISFAGQMYRLEQINVANARLSNNATHFIKASASLLRQIS